MTTDPADKLACLTPTELEVLRLYRDGLTPGMIAERRSKSVRTVRCQLASARLKWGYVGKGAMQRFLLDLATTAV